MHANSVLLIRLSATATGHVNPQPCNILVCSNAQVSQAAAKMILFLTVASGEDATDSMIFFDQVICHFNNMYSVIIEDDERVCYAYLLKEEEIIGDVWLYNTIKAPKAVDWSLKTELPFLNPSEYVRHSKEKNVIKDRQDVKIEWIMSNDLIEEANIYIKEKLTAKLKPGYNPGWSANVLKDGPLAKVLIENIWGE